MTKELANVYRSLEIAQAVYDSHERSRVICKTLDSVVDNIERSFKYQANIELIEQLIIEMT